MRYAALIAAALIGIAATYFATPKTCALGDPGTRIGNMLVGGCK